MLASENQDALVVEEVLQVHVSPTCELRPESTDRFSPIPPNTSVLYSSYLLWHVLGYLSTEESTTPIADGANKRDLKKHLRSQ